MTAPTPRKRQATWRSHDEIRRSTCGNCAAGCGVKGFVRADELVDLFGDEDHPANKGSFCPKGLLSWIFLKHPDRIRQPLVRDSLDQPFRVASWDEAIGRVARHLLAHRHDPIILHADETDSFGHFQGARAFARNWEKVIGPDAFGPRAFGPEGRIARMFGLEGRRLLMNSQRDWAFSRCILLVGSDPAASDPMTLGPLVDVRDRGGSVVVIDSKTTISAIKASYHIRVAPGTEKIFLAGVVRELLETDAIEHDYVAETTEGIDELRRSVEQFSADVVSHICEVPAEEVAKIAAIIGHALVIQVMCADWQSRGRIDDDLLGLSAALLLLRGSIGIPGGGLNLMNNTPFSAGCEGQLYLENAVTETNAAFLAVQGNPFARMAGGAGTRQRIAAMPMVMQIGAFLDETSALAHVVLPQTSWAEEAGLTMYNNGRALQWRDPLTAVEAQCRPALDVWADLARACALELPEEFHDRRGTELARAVAAAAMSSEPLTAAIRPDLLDPVIQAPGGILWPCVDEKHLRFEDDRFGRGDVRGVNILFRRHRPFAGTGKRFPNGAEKIDLSLAFSGSMQESELHLGRDAGDAPLKLIATCGVDYVPGWSGGQPSPGRKPSEPILRIHPDVGLRIGLSSGSLAKVENRLGSFVGRVELSQYVGANVVWCVDTPGHGMRETSAFALFDVPERGGPRPAFAKVDVSLVQHQGRSGFALMLGREPA